MTSQVRIAVITAADTPLQEQLQALPGHPVAQRFSKLFEEATAIQTFLPHILILEHGPRFYESLGALKILSSLVPDLRLVILCDEKASPDLLKTFEENNLVALTQPYTISQLHQIVSPDAAPTAPSNAESYLQFVQGICDEINNPLMFSSGHLQLLESRLDPQNDRAAMAQVAAIRNGLMRIEGTMRKVSNMSRATQNDRMHENFPIGNLLALTEEQLTAAGLTPTIQCLDELRNLPMRGDLSLLSGALFSLAQVGLELQDKQHRGLTLRVSQSSSSIEVQMLVENAQLQAWELPHAFEPYHLNQVLQGTTLGLNLFLVRLVCRAHGGDAVASRLSHQSVEFSISFESSATPQKAT